MQRLTGSNSDTRPPGRSTRKNSRADLRLLADVDEHRPREHHVNRLVRQRQYLRTPDEVRDTRVVTRSAQLVQAVDRDVEGHDRAVRPEPVERPEDEQPGARAHVEDDVVRLESCAIEHAITDAGKRRERLVDLLLRAALEPRFHEPLGPFVSLPVQFRKNWK